MLFEIRIQDSLIRAYFKIYFRYWLKMPTRSGCLPFGHGKNWRYANRGPDRNRVRESGNGRGYENGADPNLAEVRPSNRADDGFGMGREHKQRAAAGGGRGTYPVRVFNLLPGRFARISDPFRTAYAQKFRRNHRR